MKLSIDAFPPILQPLLRYLRIDFTPRRSPSMAQVGIATVVAVVGSLLADFILVKIGVALYPSQAHYQHFQFADYSKLTIIGVLFACAGWPIVTRISSQATWLFLRLAVAVTMVLLLPDVAIWYLGQPATAVFVLVWMHLAIAVVTFLALVTLAPVRSRRGN